MSILQKFVEYTSAAGGKCRVYLYSRVAVTHENKIYVGTAVKIDGGIVTVQMDAGQKFRITQAQLDEGKVRMLPVHAYTKANEISRGKLDECLFTNNMLHPLADAALKTTATAVDEDTGSILFKIINAALFDNEVSEPTFHVTSNNHVPAFIAYDKTSTEVGGNQVIWINRKMCSRLNKLVATMVKLTINAYQLQHTLSGVEFAATNGDDATFDALSRAALRLFKLRVYPNFEEQISLRQRPGRQVTYVLMSGYAGKKPVYTLEKLYANDTQRYIDNIDSQTAADTICVFRSQDENLHNLQAAGVQTRISEFDAHRIVKQAVADKDVLLRKTQHGTGFQTGTGHLSLDETPAETVEPDRSALTRKDVRELDARVIAGKLRSYSRQLESEYPGQLPQVFTVSNNTRVLFSLTKTDKDAFGAEFVTDAGDFSESAWQMYLKMYREIKDGVDKTKTFSLAIESGFERHVLLMAFKHSRGIPYYNMPTKNVLALRMSLYNQVLKTMIDTFGPFVEHLGFVPANQRF